MNFNDFLCGLKKFKPKKIIFVGLGNEFRGDDSAGLVFLEMLKSEKFFSDSYFINAGTNPENYLHDILLLKPSAVVFIDSVHDASNQGQINWIQDGLLDPLEISTHAFSIKMIIDYLKNNLPMEVKILGIRTGTGIFGNKISQKTLYSLKTFFENRKISDN